MIGDKIIVRFRYKHPLPEDKEIFILDATANEDLIRALAPGWEIKVWDCPPIEQNGSVIQIMDYDISRNRIRKEVDRHRNGNPSWLVQVLDQAFWKRMGRHPIISFKGVTNQPAPENDILGLLTHKDGVIASLNYPCRGHNIESKTLIVLGTPYKDEATIWELAMAYMEWRDSLLPSTNADGGNMEISLPVRCPMMICTSPRLLISWFLLISVKPLAGCAHSERLHRLRH